MSPPLFFAQLPADPTLVDLIEYQATGLVVVFTALASIWFMLEVIGRYFKQRAPAPAARVAAPSAASATPAPVAPPAVASGPTPEIVAAISAAVHVVLKGRPHRVAAITAAPAPVNWAAEGRREHFSSHRVR